MGGWPGVLSAYCLVVVDVVVASAGQWLRLHSAGGLMVGRPSPAGRPEQEPRANKEAANELAGAVNLGWMANVRRNPLGHGNQHASGDTLPLKEDTTQGRESESRKTHNTGSTQSTCPALPYPGRGEQGAGLHDPKFLCLCSLEPGLRVGREEQQKGRKI